MTRAPISALLILLAQLACRRSHQVADAARSETAPRTILAGRGVIVGRAQQAAAPFYIIEWDPSIRQVEEFEEVLGRELAGKMKSAALARRVRDEYKRQYVGSDRRTMLVEMFCKLPRDWPQKLYTAPPEAGSCYVTVSYDPSTKTILDVMVDETDYGAD